MFGWVRARFEVRVETCLAAEFGEVVEAWATEFVFSNGEGLNRYDSQVEFSTIVLSR